MFNYKIIFTFLPLFSLTIADALNGQNVQEAALRDFMDSSTKPCDNFVQYSCGRWYESEYGGNSSRTRVIYPIKSQVYVNSVKEMVYSLFDDKELFENYSSDHPVIKARDYYQSCLDVNTTVPGKFELYTDFARSLLNTTNFQEDIENRADDWIKILANLRPYMPLDEALFTTVVVGNKHESSKFLFYIEKPPNTLFFVDVMTVASHLKLETEDMKGNNTVSKILQFQKDLINTVHNSSRILKNFTIDSLENEFSNLNLRRYISTVTEKEINPTTGEIYVHSEYLQKLNNLVSKTPKKIIIYYALIKLYASMNRYIRLRSDFTTDIKWKNLCIKKVFIYMDMVIARLFNKKYLKSEKRNDLRNIAQNMKKKSQEVLLQTSWIDNETRIKAIEKIEKITFDIGFPEFVEKNSQLKEWYKDVEFDNDRFFETTMSLQKIKEKRKLKLFGQSLKNTFDSKYDTNHIMYDLLENKIQMSVGLAQPPLYNINYPQYMKYAVIGKILAHKIFRALDDEGIHYDLNGNKENWWKNASLDQLNERTNCLIKQHENLGSNGKYHEDIEWNEVIADNIGLKVAYLVYQDWLNENKNNPKLLAKETIEGLNLTSNQLFFLGLTQLNCKYYYYDTYDLTNIKIRLIALLSNSKYFADAFHCSAGDNLNPAEKCDTYGDTL